MSDDTVTERYKRITEFSGKVINYLQKNTMLYESGTYIFTELMKKNSRILSIISIHNVHSVEATESYPQH